MATIYFKLKNHLKYIFIGNENIDKPKIIKTVYLTGPYSKNIFLNAVFAKTIGNANK